MVGKGTYRTKEEKARIVMEVLSSSSTIAEIQICCKMHPAFAFYVYLCEIIPHRIFGLATTTVLGTCLP